MYQQPNGGWIEIVCGSMFSGKTEELIRRLKRAEYAKQKVQIFKPAIDDRFSATRVSSHSGQSLQAQVVETVDEIIQLIQPDTDVIGIDEVQFFGWEIAELCDRLAEQGKRVIAAGLDMDFRGEPFGPMPVLMAQAEQVTKLQAICMVCSAPASRTQRLVDGKPVQYDEPVIVVGADEVYEARCRKCHEVTKSPEKETT
ncbi:MAG: thymidine kinase [Chloroflexota bacterium]